MHEAVCGFASGLLCLSVRIATILVHMEESSEARDPSDASRRSSDQVGFITFIALPLWEAWARFVTPGAPQDNEIIQLRHLRYNL